MKQNLQHTVVVFILRAHSENERREKRAVFEHVLRTSTETTIAHLLENPTFGLRNVLNMIDQTGIGRLLILQVRKNGWDGVLNLTRNKSDIPEASPCFRCPSEFLVQHPASRSCPVAWCPFGSSKKKCVSIINCNSRESNPGLIRGRDLSYHLTTIALFRFLSSAFSFMNSLRVPTNKWYLLLASSLMSHKRRGAHSVGILSVEVGTLEL